MGRKLIKENVTLTVDYVKSAVRYCPDTGEFHRARSSPRVAIGTKASIRAKNGYLKVSIDRIEYYAHRLAWFVTYGEWPKVIDHINGNPLDNRILNLRAADQTLNNGNSRRRSDNITGYKGVSYCRERRKYSAFVTFRGKKQHLGRFETAEEAHQAYVTASKALFGEFARTL